MMMGRMGAVIGNLLFPVLFDLSCLGPFVMIGSASLSKDLKVLSKDCKTIDFNDACYFFDSICAFGCCITSESGTR